MTASLVVRLEWRGENETGEMGIEPPISPQMTLRMEPGHEFVVRKR